MINHYYDIVTYATHSFGYFEKLKNNEYNIPVKVLGWGKKWNGFKDKIKSVHEYLNTKNDEDIVIFLDGFDTIIKNNPENVLNEFKKFNCKVLVSFNRLNLNYFIFGTCKNGIMANSGMYMGYVKELKLILNDILNDRCEDDQVALNKVCKKYDFIAIDTENKIFENKIFENNLDADSKAIFVSFPGGGSERLKRYYRGVIEYYQFVLPYALYFLALLLYFLPNHKYIIISLLVILITFYRFVNKSCK